VAEVEGGVNTQGKSTKALQLERPIGTDCIYVLMDCLVFCMLMSIIGAQMV